MLDYCRLCLRKDQPIYRDIMTSTTKCSDLTLIECIYWIFGVEVDLGDKYSKLICVKCEHVVQYVGEFREVYQKNQLILSGQISSFEYLCLSEVNNWRRTRDASTSVDLVDTDNFRNPEDIKRFYRPQPASKKSKVGATNIPDHYKTGNNTQFIRRCTNSAEYFKVPIKALDSFCPVIKLPRLEKSDIYKEYEKISDGRYKRRADFKGGDKVGKTRDVATSTEPMDKNKLTIPTDISNYCFHASLNIPKLENTNFHKSYERLSETTYRQVRSKCKVRRDQKRLELKKLRFLNYYYNTPTSALRELIHEHSNRDSDSTVKKNSHSEKSNSEKTDSLIKVGDVFNVEVCTYCSQIFNSKLALDMHCSLKHKKLKNDGEESTVTNRVIKRRKRRKQKLTYNKTHKLKWNDIRDFLINPDVKRRAIRWGGKRFPNMKYVREQRETAELAMKKINGNEVKEIENPLDLADSDGTQNEVVAKVTDEADGTCDTEEEKELELDENPPSVEESVASNHVEFSNDTDNACNSNISSTNHCDINNDAETPLQILPLDGNEQPVQTPPQNENLDGGSDEVHHTETVVEHQTIREVQIQNTFAKIKNIQLQLRKPKQPVDLITMKEHQEEVPNSESNANGFVKKVPMSESQNEVLESILVESDSDEEQQIDSAVQDISNPSTRRPRTSNTIGEVKNIQTQHGKSKQSQTADANSLSTEAVLSARDILLDLFDEDYDDSLMNITGETPLQTLDGKEHKVQTSSQNEKVAIVNGPNENHQMKPVPKVNVISNSSINKFPLQNRVAKMKALTPKKKVFIKVHPNRTHSLNKMSPMKNEKLDSIVLDSDSDEAQPTEPSVNQKRRRANDVSNPKMRKCGMKTTIDKIKDIQMQLKKPTQLAKVIVPKKDTRLCKDNDLVLSARDVLFDLFEDDCQMMNVEETSPQMQALHEQKRHQTSENRKVISNSRPPLENKVTKFKNTQMQLRKVKRPVLDDTALKKNIPVTRRTRKILTNSGGNVDANQGRKTPQIEYSVVKIQKDGNLMLQNTEENIRQIVPNYGNDIIDVVDNDGLRRKPLSVVAAVVQEEEVFRRLACTIEKLQIDLKPAIENSPQVAEQTAQEVVSVQKTNVTTQEVANVQKTNVTTQQATNVQKMNVGDVKKVKAAKCSKRVNGPGKPRKQKTDRRAQKVLPSEKTQEVESRNILKPSALGVLKNSFTLLLNRNTAMKQFCNKKLSGSEVSEENVLGNSGLSDDLENKTCTGLLDSSNGTEVSCDRAECDGNCEKGNQLKDLGSDSSEGKAEESPETAKSNSNPESELGNSTQSMEGDNNPPSLIDSLEEGADVSHDRAECYGNSERVLEENNLLKDLLLDSLKEKAQESCDRVERECNSESVLGKSSPSKDLGNDCSDSLDSSGNSENVLGTCPTKNFYCSNGLLDSSKGDPKAEGESNSSVLGISSPSKNLRNTAIANLLDSSDFFELEIACDPAELDSVCKSVFGNTRAQEGIVEDEQIPPTAEGISAKTRTKMFPLGGVRSVKKVVIHQNFVLSEKHS